MQERNNRKKTEYAYQKAKELIYRAQCKAEDLFEVGDLHEYLDLLIRFHNLDVYNLLLILLQYPNATHLIFHLDLNKQSNRLAAPMIKPEWKGKGIDVIVPYIESNDSNQKLSLRWITTPFYDISQTTHTHFAPPKSSYIPDKNHIAFLLESLKEVIASEYHRSVIIVPASVTLRATKLPGIMDEYTITVREDVRNEEKTNYLIECLAKLALTPCDEFTKSQINLATLQVRYCMQRILNIPPTDFPQVNKFILSNIPRSLQIKYLSLLQTTVRSLDQSISYSYKHLRQESDIIPEY